MKKLMFFAALFSFLPLGALSVQLEAMQSRVPEGGYLQLVLTSDEAIRELRLPEISGARWMKNYQQSGQQWINGKATYSRVLLLQMEKKGEVTIPAVTVISRKNQAKTAPLKVTVTEPGQAPVSSSRQEASQQKVKLADVVSGKMRVTPDKKEFYAGEEVKLELELWVDARFLREIRMDSFPRLSGTGSALFESFSLPQGKSRFRVTREGIADKNGKQFIVYRFSAAFRVVKEETLQISASDQVGVLQQSRRRGMMDDPFGDDFFDSFFSRPSYSPYKVEFLPELKLSFKALPPAPANVLNTGLVGNWKITGKLSSLSLRVGEVAEFQLEAKGEGAPEGFRAPALSVPGFRIYPPEVKKSSGLVTAKYAMIPLDPGEKSLSWNFGVFAPAKGKYEIFPVELHPAAAPGSAPKAPAPMVRMPKTDKAPAAPPVLPEPKPSEELFYQKESPGNPVLFPLIDNHLWLILILLAGGPIAGCAIEFFYRRRIREAADANTPRRRRNQAEAKAVLKELKRSGNSEIVRSRILPLLGERYGLGAGVSAGEIAAVMKDPELAKFFADLDSSGFRPDSKEEDVTPVLRKKLSKLLKKLFLFFLISGTFTLAGAGSYNALFNQGEYRKALELYQQEARRNCPGALYNMGNAAFRLNELPLARFALLRATLLAPGDPEIRANLAQISSRMPGASDTEKTFLAEMRDRFRPDHYLAAGALFWCLMWIFWAFRRQEGSAAFWTLEAVAALLLFGAVASFMTQMKSTYNPARIIVTARELPLRSLPGVRSGKVEFTLPGGSEGVRLSRESENFVQVRINGREGWAEKSAIRPLLPGGVL